MAALLTHDEATTAIDRVLRGVLDGEEAEAWLALAERSLGLPEGSLAGPVYYPDQYGLDEDAGAALILSVVGHLAREE